VFWCFGGDKRFSLKSKLLKFDIKVMKSPNPNRLLLLGAFTVAICCIITFFVIELQIYHHINWLFLASASLGAFLFSYFIFSFIIRRFIYDKIKIIYKTIHTLKVPKEEKVKNIDLHEDIIHKVSKDVTDWAEEHKKEIDDLKKLEIYRKEFLGNVSHELKTPIFNIQGYILTLLDGAMDDPEVKKEYLEKTEKNIERMINIVQDLEIISQLESGEIKLDFSKFDIVSLTREIFELLEIKVQMKNISFQFHENIGPDTKVFVYADKDKIRQVLINLIDNSIKYGKEGGRTKLSFYDMDENVLIEVSDNGIGVEENSLPRLFERFFRVDKSRSRNQGGSGLGLAIVKHIVESHKQTINVRSAPGVGSTFSFTLKKG
jgi:two-component system phosphate regulon sensor histidine kinase PhoR